MSKDDEYDYLFKGMSFHCAYAVCEAWLEILSNIAATDSKTPVREQSE